MRREYNSVMADMDSLFRLYGHANFAELASEHRSIPSVTESNDLVLIFWADDEAQVYLNGYLVGQTRLTPVLVEIPRFYLREQNVLSAHCWDTDRVVYGFMAGLYLRDSAGGLREVVVTDEDSWSSNGVPTAPSYPPTFSQPDIPGARVIWKEDQSYGSVWLETQFSAKRVGRAAYERPHLAALQVSVKPMLFNEVVTHISYLRNRQQQLEELLARRRFSADPIRYRGFVRSDIALTLGHAGRLSEELSVKTAADLTSWAQLLPQADNRLVFRDPRNLKGLEEATAGLRKPPGIMDEEDEERRLDYQPPPERGPASWVVEAGTVVTPTSTETIGWRATLLVVGLFIYTGFVARSSWVLYVDEVWKQ